MTIYKNIYITIIFLILLVSTQKIIDAQYSVSGSVYYSDNLAPVTNDAIYILIYNNDLSQSEFLDSACLDQTGNYKLYTNYNDSALICVGSRNKILNEDHVQTYYPSTVDWEQAQKIYPPDNPININIAVTRIIPMSGNSFISGTITTLDSNNNIIPLSNALVIGKQDASYRNASITDYSGNYILDSLASGTFTILATKIGYSMDSTTVATNGNSINSNHPKLKLNKIVKSHHSVTNRVSNKFNLYQNYPNPFNPSTKIKFSIPPSPLTGEGHGGEVTLKIFDLLGREVTTLVNETLQPGTYEITWDAFKYSSGIYFYEFVSGNYKNVKKMLLIK